MVRCDSCAAYYWHQREKTRQCMRGEWFFTGDRYLETADGRRYPRHGGVCLETQHFPDSPNRPQFPSVVVRPGDRSPRTMR